MELTRLFFLIATLTTTVFAALKNTTQEFHIKTTLIPGQSDKEKFDNLWIEGYHSGAGFNDAVFVPSLPKDVKAFLNGTKGTGLYHNLVFDLGTTFPWYLDVQANTNFYAAWEPVGIDVDFEKPSGFFINETGIQFTEDVNAPHTSGDSLFGGWIVCEWWRGVPQLFSRVAYYSVQDYPPPCSCADVYLTPVYF